MDFEEEFNNLSMKFLFVCENPIELNAILNDFNSLDLKYQQISNINIILRFFESLIKIDTNFDVNIKVKAFQLIKQLINKQKVNLPEVLSNKIIKWIFECNRSEIFACEALDVLSLLFRKNSKAVLAHFDVMLTKNGKLIKLLSPAAENLQKIQSFDYTPQEVYKSALSCIESMLLHLEQSEDFEISNDHLEIIGKTLIKFIYEFKPNDIQDNDFMSIVTLVINSLKFITQGNPDFTTENVGELIGISRSFMLFALPDFDFQLPTKVMSSQQAIMEPISMPKGNLRNPHPTSKPKKGPKGKNQKKNEGKKSTEENPYQAFAVYRTSDSDFSDNEYGREMVNRNKQAKLRLAALSLLFVVATEVEKKVIFGYWHCLLSTDDACQPITLGNSILKDSSPRCRIVALQTIIQLMKNSKPFLIQAENKEKAPTKFTPFSVTLGNMIAFTYDKLTQALIKEGDLTVLTQILKCISIFVTVTPFHRLRTGIVSGFVKYVRLLVRHKDPTIKVAALIVIKNLILLPDMTTEILEIVEIPKSKIEFNWRKIDESLYMAQTREEDEMLELEFDEEEDELDEDEQEQEAVTQPSICVKKMPWVLQTILENLGIYRGILRLASIAVSVRVESLQVLMAMASHYLLLKDHLLPISTALTRSFREGPPDEKLYATRALEFLGSSIINYLSQEQKTQQDLDLSLAFWIHILPNVFENIQDDTQPTTFRASLADCLSNIGVHIFEKLDNQKQTQLKSILTGCCYDEDPNVRSSAARALSLYVLFPSLRDDLCFIENTIEAVLRIIKDQNLISRTKSSFGLANIVDSLVVIKDTVSINENFHKQIIESCLHAGNDNDRVKVNIVRTLGNSIVLLTRKQLENENWQKLFEKSVEVLCHQLTSNTTAKVKWNICYAFSSIMKNEAIFDEHLRKKWQPTVYKKLTIAIETSPNFKVRTNACIALITPKTRLHYGEFFIDIWKCLLNALEQSNNLTDFSEYKHRDALQNQLCLALSHFLKLTIVDDLIPMKTHLFPLIDVTNQNWNRVINRLPPESQSDVLKSCNSIEVLSCKSTEQKHSQDIFVKCFKPADQFF